MSTGQRSGVSAAITAAWLLTAVFYFYQYAMRSAPAVMMPELSTAFDGLASLFSTHPPMEARIARLRSVTVGRA